jgi:hypothetical protein
MLDFGGESSEGFGICAFGRPLDRWYDTVVGVKSYLEEQGWCSCVRVAHGDGSNPLEVGI